MAFDIDGWKRAVGERLSGVVGLARDAGATAYGALCAMTIWPAIEAMRTGDPIAGFVFGGVAAGIGSNLVAGHLQKWMADQTDEPDIAVWASEAAAQDERLRDEPTPFWASWMPWRSSSRLWPSRQASVKPS